MKILFDTNVILDVLMNRQPFVGTAIQLMAHVELRRIEGYLCATTVTTLHYLIARARGTATANRAVEQLLSLFAIAPVDRLVLQSAVDLGFDDYEDAVLHEAARIVGNNAIVTRNQSDFRRASLIVYSPSELLVAIRQA